MHPPSLLDTDILSELFKGHNLVKTRASEYIRKHGRLTISHIAKYEILKGLKGCPSFPKRGAVNFHKALRTEGL